MFTGLIAEVGQVMDVEETGGGVRIRIESGLAAELNEGDSVAVNGVCLTATEARDGGFCADVMRETLRRSSLAEVAAGRPVNLELPVRATDRLGGHIVQGHVDGVGSVRDLSEDGFSRRMRIDAAPELLRYVVLKGSVTVDGVSLTVAELCDRCFTVSLIPETLERTTLGLVSVGDPVNLEVDVLAKYVERLVRR